MEHLAIDLGGKESQVCIRQADGDILLDQVRVVPAQLVRSLGVGARGVKNDRSDARVLSEVSCRIDLPTVHIPSQRARDRKTMCGMREGLVECRTKLINTVRGWLRAEARRLRSGDTKTLPRRVREAIKDRPLFVERLLASIEDPDREKCGAAGPIVLAANRSREDLRNTSPPRDPAVH